MLALIGFDSASPAIVDELLAENSLPTMQALHAAGTRVPLDTPAEHFPAAAFTTVWSGVPVGEHGIYYPFMWSAG